MGLGLVRPSVHLSLCTNDPDRWHNEGGWCDFSDLYEAETITPIWLAENFKELETV